MLLHASCITIDKKAVLVAGSPGSGKSDLALRLIDDGAKLVADDQTELNAKWGRLYASVPKVIAGMIEVRYVGLLKMPRVKRAEVKLYIELANTDEKLERLPDEETIALLGIEIRKLKLPAFEVSTPAKIRAVLAAIK